MDKNKVEENVKHELNKILLLCEYENKCKNNTTERYKVAKIENESMKYYFYFAPATRELMAKNLGISSERQLRRNYESPLSILDNFDICCKMAEYQKISYIDMMLRIVDDKSANLSYQSSLIDSIKLYEDKFSKEARRKLSKLILVIIENNIDIDCFYDNTIFLVSKNQYKREYINRIKLIIGGYSN